MPHRDGTPGKRIVGYIFQDEWPSIEEMKQLWEHEFETIKEMAIRLGKPLIRQSFPGPDADKLTVDEYAFELGKASIMIELGLCEEVKVEDLDKDMIRIKWSDPFLEMDREIGDIEDREKES